MKDLPIITWSRRGTLFEPGYEVSTAGDRRFSALTARISAKSIIVGGRRLNAANRTIEELYQLDVKGYRKFSDDWRTGKGQPTLNGQTRDELWSEYLELWWMWASDHPRWMGELRANAAAKGNLLTDQFATSDINQARALAKILNGRRF